MKLKKIIAAVLSAATVLSLAGCGKEATSPIDALNSNPSKTSSAANSKSSAANSTPSSPESSAPESSVPEEPEATNVLYAQGEKLDFPETPATDFDYEIRDKWVYIKEYFGDNSDVRIPETIEGKRVCLGIYSSSTDFTDHDLIKRLILPANVHVYDSTWDSFSALESVTFLGSVNCDEKAFSGAGKLNSIYFGGEFPEFNALEKYFDGTPWFNAVKNHDGLVVLGDKVIFGRNCTGDIVISESVTKIGYGAFSGAEKLTGVKLPEGLKEIGQSAFSGTGLTEIKIPESVTSIGSAAFASTKLNSINIQNVTSIGRGAFNSTPYLEGLYNDKNLAIDGKWLLNVRGVYGNVGVPNGVTHIADYAFSGAKMQSLALPDGLVSVGNYAFDGAEFKQIAIPDSLEYAGFGAFKSLLADKYKDSEMVVFGKVAAIGHIRKEDLTLTIPDGVKSVSNNYNYIGVGVDYSIPLKSLMLPDSICYYSEELANCAREITYKGKTYETYGSNSASEREALKAAIEGN